MARERGLPSNSLSAIGVVRHDLRDGCHGLHIPGRGRIPLGQLQDCHRKGAGCLTRAAGPRPVSFNMRISFVGP